MAEGTDGAGGADSSARHVAKDHAAWRTGRPSKARYSARTSDDEQDDDPGWVEGILQGRALVGLFDNPEESQGSSSE
ncbi:MAG: hypothetical protein ACLQFR_21820 [Streptosporangiaceae bacterium]